MTLDEFRAANPAYKDVPDDKLADGIYQKFYAGKVNRDDFNAKIGLKPSFTSQITEPIRRLPGDIAEKFGEGRELARSGIQDIEKGGALNIVKGAGKAVAGGFEEAISPMTGAARAFGSRPVERAIPGETGKFIGGAVETAESFAMPGAASKGLEKAGELFTKDILPMAQKAVGVGYVLPPRMIGERGMPTKALEAWGGKIKTEQEASQANQIVTNELSAKGLGLPPDTMLTKDVFTRTRADAWKQYLAVSKSMPEISPDMTLVNDLYGLGAKRSSAARDFSESLKNPDIDALRDKLFDDFMRTNKSISTDSALELVRQFRYDASVNIKNQNTGTRALGYAQRQAADAVDGLIERRLTETGADPAVMQNYRDARRMIAISHDLEAATNTATGDVSAHAIASLARKGRPLSGELQTIAETAQSFPRATRFVSQFGGTEPYSVLDFAFTASNLAHGNIGTALLDVGRAPVRSAILSKPYQRRLTRQALTGQSPAEELLARPGTGVGTAATDVLSQEQQ